MEIKDIFRFVKKYLWLLLAGLGSGIVIGLVLILLIPQQYEGVSKVLINRNYPDKSSTYGYLTDAQLIQTFQYLIKTESILGQTSQKMGFVVDEDRVRVENVTDTMILQIFYRDRNPQVAADTANTLVKVLIDQNQALQAQNYANEVESLNKQIDELKTQIDDLESQYQSREKGVVDSQISQVDQQILNYSDQIKQLKIDIASLGTPLDPSGRSQLAELQAQLDEIQPLLTLYQQIRTNLEYLGRPYQAGSGGEDQVLTRLNTLIGQYQDVYFSLIKQLEDIQLASTQNISLLLQIETAIKPQNPVPPDLFMNPAILALVGLILALFVAMIMQVQDTMIVTPEQVKSQLGLTTLARIKHALSPSNLSNPRTWNDQFDPDTEKEFLSLRTSLELVRNQTPFRSLLVTSFIPQEGKTTVAVNLAINYASGGLKTVLANANFDLLKIGISQDAPASPGLSDVLFSNQDYSVDLLKNTGVSGVRYLPLGISVPGQNDLVESKKIQSLMTAIVRGRNIVIFDGANLSEENTRLLCSYVDAILVVLRPGSLRAENALEILRNLHVKPDKIIGVVLNEYMELGNHTNGLMMRIRNDIKTNGNNHGTIKKVFQKQGVVSESKIKRFTGW